MPELYRTKENCCGCSACICTCPEQAIIMQPDEEGFLYPKIDDVRCVDCGLCTEVCVFQTDTVHVSNREEPKVYAVKHKSDAVRQFSSSGGAFTAISDLVLASGGMVYGAAFDAQLRVHHRAANTAAQRDAFRGSKYVQSSLGIVFTEIRGALNMKEDVLFSGTACQVAGLKSFLFSSHTKTDNLLTVDVICHGTPSPKLFAEYISLLEIVHQSSVENFFFRSKVNGWGFTQQAIFSNGTEDHVSELSQAFKELFLSNICLRPACHNCKYTNIFRPSDITISDYKGIDEILPEFSDVLGVSAMMVNTAKGNNVFHQIEKDLISFPGEIHRLADKQLNLRQPTPANPNRDEFWRDYYLNGFGFVIDKYTSWSS